MPDYIPALKAQMGDWVYYVTVMKLGKIARECRGGVAAAEFGGLHLRSCCGVSSDLGTKDQARL